MLVEKRRPASEAAYGEVMAEHWSLVCDAEDPRGIARFWALALGYVPEPGFDVPDAASIVDPDGTGPTIGFVKAAAGKTVKNRIHLDIRVAGPRPWNMAERGRLIGTTVSTLVAAGATAIREAHDGDNLDYVMMQDPEGNEFCVA